jgi:hypothetical protein
MTPYQLPLVVSLVFSFVGTLALTRGDDKKDPPKAPDYVVGSVADAALAKKAPAAGVVVTKKGWDELIKTWDIKKPFEVDFDKQLVVVATNQGSGIQLTTELDDEGNLAVKVIGTADLRPGFRYAVKRIDRTGIKTINGKAVPKE